MIARALPCILLLFAASPALPAQRALSFEQRVAAQKAIEQVYWDHRIWPKENAGHKPPLSAVISDDAILAKVEDYLAKSNLLEKWWKHPVTAEQLQAEMDRMASQTKDAAALHDLFHALGDDPSLIAETLARQTLVDRLIRNWYASDTRRHGTFDAWWEGERVAAGTQIAPAFGTFTLPQVPLSPCTNDTWQRVFTLESRLAHTAVWTGTEMIVWGGTNGADLNSGGRYNPSTDSWTPTSMGANVPGPRSRHTAVWTGTRMIVWGGRFTSPQGGGAIYNDGGRYNPAADTWTSTSTGPGVPSSRTDHTAVWTGSEMIVWGGANATNLNTGGRYNPTFDTWQATSTGANVPVGRYRHTAVWAGSAMLVWGGKSGDLADLNSGARYVPSSDSWTATSVGANLPAARFGHSAVWTGTEMIVWGGSNASGDLNSGARYRSSTNTWTPTSTGAGTPVARHDHIAVWTGTAMIVWGGGSGAGARYSPASDSWTPTSTGANLPTAHQNSTAVWSGTEMIVWGGSGISGYSNTGGRYNPATDSWIPMSTAANPPDDRWDHTAVWTGAEMIVWGGQNAGGSLYNTGGRYTPATDAWAPTSTGSGVPAGRITHTAVWTGTEMIVWGGITPADTDTGGRYNPLTDTWHATSVGANTPAPRESHTAVWTGSEMVVWGGFLSPGSYLDTGGRYAPSSDSWTPTSTGANLPAARSRHTAVWTGTEMIVWGGLGTDGLTRLDTGGRYDVSADTWLATSLGSGLPAERSNHSAVWTGTEMIVWGGLSSAGSVLDSGGRYNPSTDGWLATSSGPSLPAMRVSHAAVWTGAEMIVWGGEGSGGSVLNSGGRYDPSTDAWTSTSQGANVPSPRALPSSVWTGTEMIVWGGSDFVSLETGARYCACPNGRIYFRDADGDGYGDPGSTIASCNGSLPAGSVDNDTDCNDASAAVHPGAAEINDGVDNQCPGDPGFGMIDELGDSGAFAADKVTFSLAPQQDATSYQFARSTTPSFTTNCTLFSAPSPSLQDVQSPAPGTAFYYIARAASPFIGSWGTRSSGLERTTSCP